MALSAVAGRKLNMLNNKLYENVVDKDVRIKVEGRMWPLGPKLGGSFTIPIDRTRGPEVPQSTTGGCSGKATETPTRFSPGFRGIDNDFDEDEKCPDPRRNKSGLKIHLTWINGPGVHRYQRINGPGVHRYQKSQNPALHLLESGMSRCSRHRRENFVARTRLPKKPMKRYGRRKTGT